MAIKIKGDIVIDDSRVLTVNNAEFTGNTHIVFPVGNTAARPSVSDNGMIRYNNEEDTFEGYAGNIWGPVGGGEIIIIDTPVNVQPANESTNIIRSPTLQSLGYFSLYGRSRANTQYQVSTLENFSNTVVDVTVAGLTHTIETDLEVSTTYYWRHRHRDIDSCFSKFSQSTEFTTRAVFGPTALGQSFDGGFYSGVINIGGGVCYYLVVAPNSTGCVQRCWKTTSTTTAGTTSCVNGYTNTYGPLSNATHPAGNFTATRTINGFSDWYLPAKDELNLMFTNRGSMPAGEGYNTVFGSFTQCYWSSTENSPTVAWLMNFTNGSFAGGIKTTDQHTVRAIRRYRV